MVIKEIQNVRLIGKNLSSIASLLTYFIIYIFDIWDVGM